MLRKFNPQNIYQPHGNYFNAVEVSSEYSMIYSSGIIGARLDGVVISDPEEQISQAWKNVAAFLDSEGLNSENLVRMTMHLTNINYLSASKNARVSALGERMGCAVTGLIVGLFDPELVIEIDLVAAKRR
jgi:enamine deaminase RidA (YjgF/YER057c/UK114 family)